MISLPRKFDQNEWVVIACLIFLILILKILPKRFPLSITILILAFSIAVSRVVDHLIAGPSIDFYDVMDTGKYELFDFLCYIPYALFAYIFVYLYDKWNIKGIGIMLYILGFSLFGVAFEWLAATPYIHFFNYKKWNMLYSLGIYLFIQPCTLLFYRYIKNVWQHSLRT